jgi:hypothetical protein
MVSEAVKPVAFVAAAIYIAIDELFSFVTQPIAAGLARLNLLQRVRAWIVSLPPYPALALFAVPLIILEPVKPVAAYLAATGHFGSGAMLFVTGELLKLILVERLFYLNKRKLLSVPAFAWCYQQVTALREWLEATAVFRQTRQLVRRAESLVRELVDRWTSSDSEEASRARARVRTNQGKLREHRR